MLAFSECLLQGPIKKGVTNYKTHQQLLHHQKQKYCDLNYDGALLLELLLYVIERTVLKLFRQFFKNLSLHCIYTKIYNTCETNRIPKASSYSEFNPLNHFSTENHGSCMLFPIILFTGPSITMIKEGSIITGRIFFQTSVDVHLQQ